MKKKILFLIESLAGGGAEKVLVDIVKSMNKDKYDITVMTVVKTGVYVKKIERECRLLTMLPDMQTIHSAIGKLKYRYNYHCIYNSNPSKIYKKYIKEKFDIEIAFVEGFATKIIGYSTNPKSKKYAWIHTDILIHNYADTFFENLNEEKWIYQKMDKVFCVSKAAIKAISDKFGAELNLKLQYNPLNVDEIIQKAGSQEKSNKEFKIITVGRLTEQKGYDRLLIALKNLIQEYPFIKLQILGEGIEEKQLKQYCLENAIEQNVEFLGFCENPYKYMKNADLFVCSSRVEGFSLVIGEALVLGLPVLSTKCSGPEELLDSGKYGVIVENSTEGIYNGLKTILKNPSLLKSYTEKSKERREFFELKKRIQEIECEFD